MSTQGTPSASNPSRPIGFHVSIAGGLHKAVPRAIERECTAVQIFCDNPRGWTAAARTPEEMEALRLARREAGLAPLVVHACYLINPCARDRSIFHKSIRRMAHELTTAADAGADFYVVHPGSPKGKPHTWAVKRAADAIAEAAQRAERFPTILLENTAAAGAPGSSLEGLGELIADAEARAPALTLGIAVDSCHAFVAGYDVRRLDEVERLVADVRSAVGLDRLHLLHANDARDEAGSRRDRHWHIGEGCIGDAGIRNLCLHNALRHLPIILETPWESVATDLRNIRRLRSLIAGPP